MWPKVLFLGSIWCDTQTTGSLVDQLQPTVKFWRTRVFATLNCFRASATRKHHPCVLLYSDSSISVSMSVGKNEPVSSTIMSVKRAHGICTCTTVLLRTVQQYVWTHVETKTTTTRRAMFALRFFALRSTTKASRMQLSTLTQSVKDVLVKLTFVDPSGARRQVNGLVGKSS